MSNHKDYSYRASLRAVPASSESFILLECSSRIGAIILNSSSKNLYVCFSDKASREEYTALLPAGSQWEVPASYQGPVSGVCPAGVGGDVQTTSW